MRNFIRSISTWVVCLGVLMQYSPHPVYADCTLDTPDECQCNSSSPENIKACLRVGPEEKEVVCDSICEPFEDATSASTEGQTQLKSQCVAYQKAKAAQAADNVFLFVDSVVAASCFPGICNSSPVAIDRCNNLSMIAGGAEMIVALMQASDSTAAYVNQFMQAFQFPD